MTTGDIHSTARQVDALLAVIQRETLAIDTDYGAEMRGFAEGLAIVAGSARSLVAAMLATPPIKAIAKAEGRPA